MPDVSSQPEADRDLPQPRVPDPVRVATEATFATLARVRRARPFHPRGASFTATVTPLAGQPLAFLGDEPRPALVRCSNAAGLPARMPDVFGLGIRIPDAVRGGPQDFLLVSAGDAPVVRHLLVPARGYDTATRYSSLLLYRHQGALRLIGARYRGPALRRPLRLADLHQAAAEGALVFSIAMCAPTSRWRPIAELRLHERLPASASRRLRFDPWNTASELRPVGPLNHLRASAYEASQRTATSE